MSLPLSRDDSDFLALLRALAILVIVIGHVGIFWINRPASEFLHVFVAVFFFISGAVSFHAFERSNSVAGYLAKRLIGLFVPYYLMVLVALVVYLLLNASLPPFSWEHLYRWLTIIPRYATMPFPLGQLWFLNTLLWISLISPLYFLLYRHYPRLLWLLLAAIAVVATIQLFTNLMNYFWVLLHGFYKPLIHSLFFCLGVVVMNSPRLRSPPLAATFVAIFTLASWGLVKGLALDPDYAAHTYSPDLYYLCGCLAAIWGLLLLQPLLLYGYRHCTPLAKVFDFFFDHTFAVFLLHSLVIFIADRYLGLSEPPHPGAGYWWGKIALVLAVTALLAPPFTALSNQISAFLLARLGLAGRHRS